MGAVPTHVCAACGWCNFSPKVPPHWHKGRLPGSALACSDACAERWRGDTAFRRTERAATQHFIDAMRVFAGLTPLYRGAGSKARHAGAL